MSKLREAGVPEDHISELRETILDAVGAARKLTQHEGNGTVESWDAVIKRQED